MAIRRPSVYSGNTLVFQDFPFLTDGTQESRYLHAKYDGEAYETIGQTFDQSSPNLAGGSVVARVDYTVEGKLITIDHWEVFWRDEWPLRLSIQYLVNCLYSPREGYTVRVAKDCYSFWASEWFVPVSNSPNDYLIYVQN